MSVDDDVLRLCNDAFDEAVRRSSAVIEIAHLTICLAGSAWSRLAAHYVDHTALAAGAEQWLSFNGRVASTRDARTSEDLKVLLQRAQAAAVSDRREFATLDDLITVLVLHSFDLPSAVFVGRFGAGSGRNERRAGRYQENGERSSFGSEPRPLVLGGVAEQVAAQAHPFAAHKAALASEHSGSEASSERAWGGSVESERSAWADERILGRGGRRDSACEERGSRFDRLEQMLAALQAESTRLAQRLAQLDAYAGASIENREPNGSRQRAQGQGGSRRQGDGASDGGSATKVAQSGSRSSLRRIRLRGWGQDEREWVDKDSDLHRGEQRSGRRSSRSSQATSKVGQPLVRGDAGRGDWEEITRPDEIEAAPGEQAKRFYLSLDDDVVSAPAIGPRTAERLASAGVVSVRDLLARNPDEIAKRVSHRFCSADCIRDWQAQARLVCTIPSLRGTHAQLLVGAGYRSIDEILAVDAPLVCAAVLRFAATRDGQRILRSGPAPDIERIMQWVKSATLAEPERAAA